MIILLEGVWNLCFYSEGIWIGDREYRLVMGNDDWW